MPFIGVQPASALLTSADIQDGQITTAKIANDAVDNTKLDLSSSYDFSAGLTLGDNLTFDVAGKGVHLGVTSATASNLMDDYEEGTFTPTSTVGSLSVASGVYRKIGKLVHIGMKFTLPTSSDSNSATISNLPFTVYNDNAGRAGIVVSWNSNGQGNAGLDFLLIENTTSGIFYIEGASRTYANLSADTVYMGGTYPVA